MLATSHPFPLHSEVGSSAFSYVDFECSAIINEHNRLRADSRSTCEFLLPETANIFQGGYQAVAARNVSASFRTPKTQVHVALRRLAGCSRAGCYLPPLWPRVVARHGHCQWVALVRLFLRHERLPICSALVRVIHVVGRTLGCHAYRIVVAGACFVISTPVETTLPSCLVRKFSCVGLRAMPEIPCLCCRQALMLL